MRHNPTDSIIDDPFPSSLTWFSRAARPINEVKRIASVSGNVITFTTPLHIDYPTTKASQVTRYQDVHVQNAGVESLKMLRGSDGTMRFEVAAFCWVKNVEITVWEGEGVAINNAFGVEVRDSYIHEAAYSTPGGGAYAISFANASSETLIENNIVMKANKVMVARSAGAGSVVAYNYMDDGLIQYDLTWNEVGINASHMVGSHHVLFEGSRSLRRRSPTRCISRPNPPSSGRMHGRGSIQPDSSSFRRSRRRLDSTRARPSLLRPATRRPRRPASASSEGDRPARTISYALACFTTCGTQFASFATARASRLSRWPPSRLRSARIRPCSAL